MDPFFLCILLTIRLNIITMEKKQTPKTDDTEVLNPVVEEKKADKKAAKAAAAAAVKKAEEKAAKDAEAERIRLRNLGYI